jgi:integrase
METLGREPEWDRKKAERALGAGLADVQKGMRKPARSFDALADRFEEVAMAARPRKKTTVESYKQTTANHLRPWFGSMDLGRLAHSPDEFERYAAAKMADGLSPKIVRNHLVLLGLMFKTARRWRWVQENPLELVEKPALPDRETETIDASTIAELLAAYRLLEAETAADERFWFEAGRRMTVVALSTGLRRGELLGLRWRDVDLLERRLTVSQQFVRQEITSPKSRAGRRTLTTKGPGSQGLSSSGGGI